MADPSTSPPLIPSSIRTAHAKIKQYIHRTPLITNQSLNKISSSPDPGVFLSDNPPPFPAEGNDSEGEGVPRFRIWMKCENQQRIGAFKARGAFHAITRLIDEMGIEEVRRVGVVTHSSGNHAQALALAASTFWIPSYIVMPKISTPSKIAGTRLYTRNVVFSGSTSTEREAVTATIIKEHGAILVPPYDHPDIILGQGTSALELEEQFHEQARQMQKDATSSNADPPTPKQSQTLDAVLTPLGGGGLLGGTATWFSDKADTVVFGCEPSFQGADDGRRGVLAGQRIEHVKTLTIADGLRTPVGVTNWSVISDRNKVEAIYSVSEDEIKMAMRLVFERVKVVVEPSAAVPLAVVLFNTEFRALVAARQLGSEKGFWDVGIVFSGGNTTMKAIASLFAEDESGAGGDRDRDGDVQGRRAEGIVASDGSTRVEDVAG
ncbi:threonine dehydratase [Exophiala aquamarina CBS 119918]|uniref:Threonine dehydratase n=1 Tax=Exophiala aquamarina CBS 119918 TaxID=1182545 RepID=A0A072PQU0_9EURO|nr:threonine dehydratase [Exophiala aquamarina CBS 119918]KEF62479.1 threonine dehydratase [Exophiala aquamarina CBS 119918]